MRKDRDYNARKHEALNNALNKIDPSTIQTIGYKEEVPIAIWMQKKEYIKLFISNVIDIITEQNVSASSFMVLNVLLENLAFQSNCVTYYNGKPLCREEIIFLVHKRLNGKFAERTIEDCLQELRRAEIIAISKTGDFNSYYINPCLYFRGNYINKNLYTLFYRYIERHPEYKRDFTTMRKIHFGD